MGVFVNQGNVVLQWAAKHAVETSRESDLLADAASEQKQALLERDMHTKEVASSVKQMQQNVQIGLDGVKTVQSSQNLGKTIKEQQSAKQNLPVARDNLQAVRDNPGDAEAWQQLRDTPLGDGRTVGDRFSDDQLRVLTGQDTDLSEGHLREIGFRDSQLIGQKGEIENLRAAGRDRDGLTNQDAAGFMISHKKTANEVKAEYVRTKLQEAINTNVDTLASATAEATRRSVRQSGQKARDAVKNATDLFGDVLQTDLQHQKELGKIDRDYRRAGEQDRNDKR